MVGLVTVSLDGQVFYFIYHFNAVFRVNTCVHVHAGVIVRARACLCACARARVCVCACVL